MKSWAKNEKLERPLLYAHICGSSGMEQGKQFGKIVLTP
jgi:hypothetical protein